MRKTKLESLPQKDSIVHMDTKHISPTSSMTITTKGNTARIIQATKYYYMGKEGNDGYHIMWGVDPKNDLKHAFKSTTGVPIDNKLENKATKYKEDKFNPKAFVWLSDMRYEEKNGSIGWTYKVRTEPVEIKEELSAIVNDSVDLDGEFIPLNTRLEDADYEKNGIRIYWKKEESPYMADEITLENGHVVEM